MSTVRLDPRIREAELIDLTRRLVRIPSQYVEGQMAQHHEIARFLAQFMQDSGLEVTVLEPVPDYPCVVGRLRGTGGGPVVGFIGHYSTVAAGDPAEWQRDPFGGELIDGRIYGRGAFDQKGAIAVALLAARALKRSGTPLRGDALLLMVPGEGCTELCLRPVVAEQPDFVRADYYIDTDGEPDSISVAHGGYVWLELIFHGRGGHPGVAHGGVAPINPVHKMFGVLSRMLRPEEYMTYRHHPLFGPEHGRYSREPIVEATGLRGSAKVNQIPDSCRAQVDIRMVPGQTAEGVLQEVRALLDRLQEADPELKVQVEVLGISHNKRQVPLDHPAIALIQETCREAGIPIPQPTSSVGGGRASLATLGPVMHFGAGAGDQMHAADEYADVARLTANAGLYARLMARLLA